MKIANECVSVWVLLNPDNGHWNEMEARQEISCLAKVCEVEALETSETRDVGFGQEERFILEGSYENIGNFLQELDEILY